MKAQVDYAYVNLGSICVVCGKKGTVTWLEEDGFIHDTDMCGMCTWGSAEDDDPRNWAHGSINPVTHEVKDL